MPVKRSFFFLIIFSVTCFACKKVDIQFGDQFLDNGYTQVIKVDSFAADISTVYVDSFITSGEGVTMIGAYTDPVFGQITTNNYFEIIPPTYANAYIADSFRATTFDSLVLILKPDKSYLGDTTHTIHINVNILAQPIVPYDNSPSSLYNTQSFSILPNAIGSKDVSVRPNANDSIVIRLNDNLGQALLKKFQDPNDADIRTSDAFLQYLYGLRLSTGNNSQLIFGCKDSAIVRMYYKQPGLYTQNRSLDFTLANASHHFNNITVDRSSTILKNLATAKELNSSITNNTAYTLYAAGAMAKIRFPTIRNVLKLPNYTKILNATLVVRPVRGTYGSSNTLPPQLRLSSTTQLNQIGSDLSATASDGSNVLQTGNLVIDNLYGESTSYTYDLTKYIRAIITDGTINANGLLLLPLSPAMETQFKGVMIGNHNNTEGKMELLIIYASIQ